MPAPVLQSTRGVPLERILIDAGIDPGSVQRYDFKAKDDHKAYQEFTSQSLTGTARYYYPNLIGAWDNEKNEPGFGAESGAVKVQTIIALEQYMKRFGKEPAYDKMHSSSGYRLCFGMVSANDPLGAHDSVQHLTRIDCQLVGSPPDGFGDKDSDLVGSKPDNNSNQNGGSNSSGNDNKNKESSKPGKNKDGTSSEKTSAAAIGESKPGVEVSAGETTSADVLSSSMVKDILATETVGIVAQGDVPWNIYEIAVDSAPFTPPKADPMAIATVTALLALAFSSGALVTYRRYRIAYIA